MFYHYWNQNFRFCSLFRNFVRVELSLPGFVRKIAGKSDSLILRVVDGGEERN